MMALAVLMMAATAAMAQTAAQHCSVKEVKTAVASCCESGQKMKQAEKDCENCVMEAKKECKEARKECKEAKKECKEAKKQCKKAKKKYAKAKKQCKKALNNNCSTK